MKKKVKSNTIQFKKVVLFISLIGIGVVAVGPLLFHKSGRPAYISVAQFGCGTIATELLVTLVMNGGVFPESFNGPAVNFPGVIKKELDSDYFDADDYSICVVKGTSDYLITCTADKESGKKKYEGNANGMTVTFNQDGETTCNCSCSRFR